MGLCRNLKSEEIKNLPTELKACFLIREWNLQANIKTVEDWINTFNIFFDGNRDVMLYEYNRVYKLLKIFGL